MCWTNKRCVWHCEWSRDQKDASTALLREILASFTQSLFKTKTSLRVSNQYENLYNHLRRLRNAAQILETSDRIHRPQNGLSHRPQNVYRHHSQVDNIVLDVHIHRSWYGHSHLPRKAQNASYTDQKIRSFPKKILEYIAYKMGLRIIFKWS